MVGLALYDRHFLLLTQNFTDGSYSAYFTVSQGTARFFASESLLCTN